MFKNISPESRYKILKNIAIISAVAAAVLALLLIVNTIQTSMIDPLNTPALTKMMQQLEDNPQDEALQQQIRAVDLLARRAYFTHLWQVKTGSILLFVFVIIFLLAIKTLNTLLQQQPEISIPENDWLASQRSFKILAISGGVLFVLALVAGLTSQTQITQGAKPAKLKNYSEKDFQQNWPAFRGPGGNGVAFVKDAPLTWDAESGEHIAWKTELGKHGFNSPIVWDDQIYLSGGDEDSRHVYAYSVKDGSLLWDAEIKNVPGSPKEVPNVADDTGFAASTMTTDGNYVFAIFANGDVAAVDKNGQIRWTRNLGMPDNHYGHSSSLITYKDVLIIQWDQGDEQKLIGLEIADGSIRYEVERDVQISWSSPVLVNTGKRMEVIINANPFVMAHDPETGKELWRVECMDGEVAPSIAYSDGMAFAVNEYAILAGIQLGDEPKIAWEFEDEMSEVSSPVANDDYLFMCTSYGSLYCFNAKTGEVNWFEEVNDGFYSSPILVNDRVYVVDVRGVFYIFKADAEFEMLAENAMGEHVYTTPAFYKNMMIVRGDKHLFCVK